MVVRRTALAICGAWDVPWDAVRLLAGALRAGDDWIGDATWGAAFAGCIAAANGLVGGGALVGRTDVAEPPRLASQPEVEPRPSVS